MKKERMLRNLLIVLLPSLLIISVASACEDSSASDKENINEQNIALKNYPPKKESYPKKAM